MKWVVIACALIVAGWFVFDGLRAIVIGDYVTPSEGEYAGQLGPWSKVVAAVGIPPRSTAMKLIFVCFGIGWLTIIVCYLLRMPWAWAAMMVAAICSLWYLPFGTIAGFIQIVLLILIRIKAT